MLICLHCLQFSESVTANTPSCVLADHSWSGLGGPDTDADTTHTQRPPGQDLCNALGERLKVPLLFCRQRVRDDVTYLSSFSCLNCHILEIVIGLGWPLKVDKSHRKSLAEANDNQRQKL